jgi:SAM-dependent methyltransferase
MDPDPNCTAASWRFTCPNCRAELDAASPGRLTCPRDHLDFPLVDGIWRMLPPDRAAHFAPFIRQYETVRRSEGWRGPDAAYYQALPHVPPNDPHRPLWNIRARSFAALADRVIGPLSGLLGRPLRVLDLGAGNGWLSNRLRQMGHCPAAVDLLTDPADGLGAIGHYHPPFTAVQAEFDRLPFAPGQADLVIFNGAFHYAADYAHTLRAVKPALAPGGRIVIMDSPVYHDPTSGRQMVRERDEAFARDHGFTGDGLAHESFLTFARLDELAAKLALDWQLIRPAYGWRWAIRPWLARLRRGREPAAFLLIVGTFAAGTFAAGTLAAGTVAPPGQ